MLRVALSILAIFLVPWLYRHHVGWLVALRPSKEVLLFAGNAIRKGHVYAPVVAIAALPVLVGSVWVFYALGKSFRDDLDEADLPGIAGRVLPRKRIEAMRTSLDERGWLVVFLGRLAIMPSTMVAAAAGTTDMPTRTFLLADGAGAIVSGTLLVGAGFALGAAYEEAGPWFTAVGVAIVVGLLFLLGRTLRSRH